MRLLAAAAMEALSKTLSTTEDNEAFAGDGEGFGLGILLVEDDQCIEYLPPYTAVHTACLQAYLTEEEDDAPTG